MSLKDNAIEAYKKKKAESNEVEKKEAEKFYVKSLEALKERFGEDNDIDISKVEVVEKFPGMATIIVEDDIKIRITFSQGYHHFTMVKNCSKCGEEYMVDIRKIEDIGEFLTKEHEPHDCANILRAKMDVKVPNTGEKLIDVLKDFIYELQAQ